MSAARAKTKAGSSLSSEELTRLLDGAHHNPHAILGAHVTDDHVTVRALRPDAKDVQLVIGLDKVPMHHERDGIWVAVVERDNVPDYRLEVTYDSGSFVADDPYRWLPTLGEVDLHLIGEGRHEQLWEVLGACPLVRRTDRWRDWHVVRGVGAECPRRTCCRRLQLLGQPRASHARAGCERCVGAVRS